MLILFGANIPKKMPQKSTERLFISNNYQRENLGVALFGTLDDAVLFLFQQSGGFGKGCFTFETCGAAAAGRHGAFIA